MICRASARLSNKCSFRHSSRKRLLKLSMKAFWTGLPGSVYLGIREIFTYSQYFYVHWYHSAGPFHSSPHSSGTIISSPVSRLFCGLRDSETPDDCGVP